MTWQLIGSKFISMNKKTPYYLLPVLLLPWLWQSCSEKKTVSIADNNSTFVGSNQCLRCHSSESELWSDSHHFHSMEPASKESIKATFEEDSLTLDGVHYEFSKDTSGFFVTISEKNSEKKVHKIEYSFGYSPLQQYLVELPNGKLQNLRVSYDTQEKKWFHQYPGEVINHDDWLHWNNQSMNWNSMCSDCHSTQVKKNYNPEKETYQSTFSEVNVSCESCHGPASNHLNEANSGKFSSNKGFITRVDKDNYINTCGRCHSRRSKLKDGHNFKEDYYDQYHLVDLDIEHYQPDGQINEEDFVLGSFLSSKMAHRGITCNDCHKPHSSELKLLENSLCLSCHADSYNKPTHHFHQQSSTGSQCINCHMPGKTYMGNDFRRDHSFRVPRPDQSVKYGTTNSCTQCHSEKDNQWAADFLERRNNGNYPKHFSDLLLYARANHDINSYLTLISDTSYPIISRATAVGELKNYEVSNWVDQAREISSTNPSPLMRSMVQKAIFNQVTPQTKDIIANGLKDTSRSVRIIAYRNALKLPKAERINLIKSNNSIEYEDYLRYNADFKEGRNQWAEWFVSHEKNNEAILKYKTSLEIDSNQRDPYINLAILNSQEKNNKQSLGILSLYIKRFPNDDYGYYLLGILNIEEGNHTLGIENLKTAIELNPNDEKYWQNLFNVYQITQDNEGIKSLKKKYNEIFSS